MAGAQRASPALNSHGQGTGGSPRLRPLYRENRRCSSQLHLTLTGLAGLTSAMPPRQEPTSGQQKPVQLHREPAEDRDYDIRVLFRDDFVNNTGSNQENPFITSIAHILFFCMKTYPYCFTRCLFQTER